VERPLDPTIPRTIAALTRDTPGRVATIEDDRDIVRRPGDRRQPLKQRDPRHTRPGRRRIEDIVGDEHEHIGDRRLPPERLLAARRISHDLPVPDEIKDERVPGPELAADRVQRRLNPCDRRPRPVQHGGVVKTMPLQRRLDPLRAGRRGRERTEPGIDDQRAPLARHRSPYSPPPF
jgi:hypothetical protein